MKKGVNMGKELRILILEDVLADATLMQYELRKAGIAFITERVETREDFLKGIQDFVPNLILADFALPSFDGLSALAIAREQCPEVPFIFVTGSLSEEIAVECMKSGAADYVLKDHLVRIGTAVKGALEKKRTRGEKERAEEVLRVSDIRYRRLFESAKDGILLLDGETAEITDVNPYMVEMLGYHYDEFLGKKLCDVSPFRETEETQNFFRELQKEGYIRYENLSLQTKEKKPIDVEFVSNAYDVDGKKVIQCNIRDITGRKRAEEALGRSETKFYELFNDAPVGYFEYDNQGRITSVNRTELEMLGYTLEEILGQPVWKFAVELDEARHRILAKLAGIMPPARGREQTYRRKDGTTFPALIEDRLLKDSDGKIIGIRSTIQSIAERKQMEKEKALLEEQLRQSQKMEAMGRLAGGIAHDFNNLLTIIKGYSQLFLIDLKKGDPMEKGIEQIQKATQRAGDLIRQLLAFSRRQVMEMRVLDLNSLLSELDKMLRRVIGEDIVLVTLLTEDLGRVKADPGQLGQVLMNLVVNARDAMPSGGKLTIEMANVVLDEEYVRTHIEVPPGRYVVLSVSDTGVGMTPEVRDRIFEPFFTTKEKGKGTGLGLSTVYGIVKQSGGNILVYSEPGKGTTFKIYLPIVDEPLEEWAEMVVEGEIPRGKETILIVEDFEEVRQLTRQVLERQGYQVLEAGDGNATLLVCEKYKGQIHLMMTDVVMPGMSGRELADRIKSSHPEMKVLYTSGYADDTIVHYGVSRDRVNYLQKPFTMEGLARKVREVLDK
jgi:two-component system, cell cycle sensor histidine kinase and response regulator CckA